MTNQTETNLITIIADKWTTIATTTGRCLDQFKAQDLIAQLYESNDFPRPVSFVWVDSPNAAVEYLDRKFDGKRSSSEIFSDGSIIDIRELAKYDYARSVEPLCEPVPFLEVEMQLVTMIDMYWPYDELCVIVDRYKSVTLDEKHQFHNETGMAIEYHDGWGLYMWHGHTIPRHYSWIITNPERLNSEVIEAEKDDKLRAIMKEKFLSSNPQSVI